MKTVATIGLSAIAFVAIAAAIDSYSVKGRPNMSADKSDQNRGTTPELEAESQRIFNQFQEMKKYIEPIYGEGKITALMGMNNQEIEDTWKFMFEYADLKNGGKNFKYMPPELAARVVIISKKYNIFS